MFDISSARWQKVTVLSIQIDPFASALTICLYGLSVVNMKITITKEFIT